MNWLRGKEAGTHAKPANNASLRELLLKPPVLIKNHEKEPRQFFCKAAVEKIMTREVILAWKENNHPLHRDSDINVDEDRLVDHIVKDHCQLFAILVAAELERFTFAVLKEDQRYKTFPNIKYESLKLDPSQRKKLDESVQRWSPVLSESEHMNLSSAIVLPFTQRETTGHQGSFGQIYQVVIADGHLEGYTQKVVADKEVYLDDKDKMENYLREAKTLRRRKHPNIVPLLASYSYSKKIKGSDSVVTFLHFIFPYAVEGNLKRWMNNPKPPDRFQKASLLERQRYLYRAIYALVTGLAHIHAETDGDITAHHDLKPENILVFPDELKIADFGRSHLRAIEQGSETKGKDGLGTYEYQPPEYWKEYGVRADCEHGRSFDIYSMGCIIVELATLIVYGWESNRVTRFRQLREENTMPKISRPVHEGKDASFHNNPNVVKEWIQKLESDDGSQELHSTLEVASQMMDEDRHSRLYAWEAELDLGDIQFPDEDQGMREKREEEVIKNPPPTGKIPRGTQTPLHRAAVSGKLSRFVQLYKAGWSLSDTDSRGFNPWKIMEQNRPELCNDLRARLDSLTPGKAISNKVVSENAPVRKGFNDEYGPKLLDAAARGDLDTVQTLIQNGVDTLFVDKGKQSALYNAVKNNQCRVADYLLKANGKELLRLKNGYWNDTPLHKAASMGDVTMTKLLLSSKPKLEDQQKQGKTALFLAVEHGHEKVVDVLLDHGAQIFTRDNTGIGTLLHGAALGNRSQMLTYLFDRAPEIQRDLEYKNRGGETPLLLALWRGNVDCADVLLKNRASLHVANNDGQNVIHIAVEKGLYDFFKERINQFKKEEFQSRNEDQDTPLMIAQKKDRPRFRQLLAHR